MNATRTVDPKEAAHFETLAAQWWDPHGSSAMLHRLNPVRLGYVRAQLDLAWGLDPKARRPLAGKRVLDVGCGAGLLAEPLARLGAEVTGIDAAPGNIAAARAHADRQGLEIAYRAGGIEMIEGESFDLVISLEVIEHVSNPAGFVAGLAQAMTVDGVLILSTPNRTPLSRLALITIGEGFGLIPRGTHDWSKFVARDEMTLFLEQAGLAVTDTTGLSFDPRRGFVLSTRTMLDYFVTARRANPPIAAPAAA